VAAAGDLVSCVASIMQQQSAALCLAGHVSVGHVKAGHVKSLKVPTASQVGPCDVEVGHVPKLASCRGHSVGVGHVKV
jgi:hypothetical protein